MTDEQKLLFQNMALIINFAGPIVSAFLLWAIKSASSNLFNAVVEVKLLTQTVTNLKNEIADLPKMRLDINEAHTKIRFLDLKNTRGKQ